ncbi:LMBR1-like membrane protein-domain-containing protein [Geopyxis carbonaria]|nr:LMBR1-like membrane protein-domain-containing protein [Geopyxis carbonaria]
MAVPSAIFFGICLLVLAVVVLLLQRRYLPLRSTPEYLLVATFLPLFISSSIVILVPIDLASSSSSDDGSRGIVLPDKVLLIAWRIAYWLCFVLTWAILPLLQSYSDSGHRAPQKRIVQALRENARYHLIVLAVGACGLVYFFIVSGVHIYSLKGLVIALSYCYALGLAIYLMGHGLVAIPRGLWQDASVAGKLRKLQMKAPSAHDKLVDASNNLEQVENEVFAVRQRKNGSAREFQEWIEELVEMIQQTPESTLPRTANNSRISVPPVITEEYLAALTRKLKLCIHRRARFSREWEALVQTAANCQAIVDSKASKRLTFTKHFGSGTLIENISLFNPYTRHVFYFHLLPYIRQAIAVFLSIASAIIVWTEATHSLFPKLSVVRYTVVHHPSSDTGKIGFAGQVISAAWIAYMCSAAYYSLTAVKVWGSYALVRRMTSASSACFYASYAARLTVPLAYNFVSFLPEEQIVNRSVFYTFLGKLINLTAISQGFNDLFPILILLPVAASLFNLYGRVKATFGFGDMVGSDDDDADPFASGGWREGRDLIEREVLGSTSGGFVARAARSDLAAAISPVIGRSAASAGGGSAAPARGRYRDNPAPADDDDDADDESAWGGFVHRVKNTFDTVETPRWFKDVQERRPKWLGGDED